MIINSIYFVEELVTQSCYWTWDSNDYFEVIITATIIVSSINTNIAGFNFTFTCLVDEVTTFKEWN